jgi:hypothetical protein
LEKTKGGGGSILSIGSAKYLAQIWGGGVGAFGHSLTLLGGPIIVSIMLAILYHNLILFDHGNQERLPSD